MMKPSIGSLFGCCLLLLGATGGAAARDQIQVDVKNIGSHAAYIFVDDVTCRIRVFQGVLVEGATRTISVCAGDRGRGDILVHDRYGGRFRFRKLLSGTGVSVRFQRADLR